MATRFGIKESTWKRSRLIAELAGSLALVPSAAVGLRWLLPYLNAELPISIAVGIMIFIIASVGVLIRSRCQLVFEAARDASILPTAADWNAGITSPLFGQIEIRRDGSMPESSGPYIVLIDGKIAGGVMPGHHLVLKVDEGDHTLALKSYWCGSKTVHVHVFRHSMSSFDAMYNVTGLRAILAPWYVTLGRKSFLKLVPTEC